MLNKIILAAALFLPACAELPEEDLEAPTGEVLEVENANLSADSGEPAFCDLLPDDDTACAYACDPEALLDFIAPGTCQTFLCETVTGEPFRTGGCDL